MFLHLIAIGWLFVVVLMAAAEATAPQGSLLGALFTLLMYGVMPLAIVLYILGTPIRRKARQAQALAEQAPAPAPAPLTPPVDATPRPPDGR